MACFERTRLPPHEQTSRFPAEGETNVRWLLHHRPGAPEVAPETTKLWRDYDTSEHCVGNCSSEGVCKRGGHCQCFHGFGGDHCQHAVNTCVLGCGGHGTCGRGFCTCDPGWSGIACTNEDGAVRAALARSHVSRSVSSLRIFVYELPAWLNVAYRAFTTIGGHKGIYGAYTFFLDRLLNDSAVRTLDPREANAFLVPVFAFDAAGNVGSASWAVDRALAYIQAHHVDNWNRAGGADHIVWMPRDRGYCDSIRPELHHLLWITHYLPSPSSGTRCFPPGLQPVVAPGISARMVHDRLGEIRAELFAAKRSTLFFFAGGLHHGETVRRRVHSLFSGQPGFDVSLHVRNYSAAMGQARFCLDAEGKGWNQRLLEAATTGWCVLDIGCNLAPPPFILSTVVARAEMRHSVFR